jgi:hypothetical protein
MLIFICATWLNLKWFDLVQPYELSNFEWSSRLQS